MCVHAGLHQIVLQALLACAPPPLRQETGLNLKYKVKGDSNLRRCDVDPRHREPASSDEAGKRRLGHEGCLRLRHVGGPMASSMAQWPQAWPNGLKRGPMASSVAQWPQAWPNGLKRCTSSCGGGVNSSGGGTSQREELPACRCPQQRAVARRLRQRLIEGQAWAKIATGERTRRNFPA